MVGKGRKHGDADRFRWAAAAPWIVLALCVLIAFARPVYAHLRPEVKESWVVSYQAPASWHTVARPDAHAPPEPAAAQQAGPSIDSAFGRHLDTLTEFYDKLINFLFVLLATITALAFFTIRANTKAEQERAAFEAIDSARVKALIQEKVAEEISVQIGDIKTTLEELQGLYEVLDDAVIAQAKRKKDSGDSQAENAGS